MYEDTTNLPYSLATQRNQLRERIFLPHTQEEFINLSLEMFRFQSEANKVYASWLKALGCDPKQVKHLAEIPFLPIEFFKTHKVRSGILSCDNAFNSSGTTGLTTSTHYVLDISVYIESLLEGFRRVYGAPSDYIIIGLLPSYLERNDSSLVYMVNELMKCSGQVEKHFYLNDYVSLKKKLDQFSLEKKKVWLIGVSFALLEFAELKPATWEELIVIETGGMKGRRKEIIREELHSLIRESWQVNNIHSEYGMTELLSQAWLNKESRFNPPPWMQIRIRDANDPFHELEFGKAGGINIIDLANIDSCSFISTSDLGKKYEDGSFEVLGRFDNSDLRGCNLLAEI
ncbi:MAG: acyl transferase [Bacteroidia bacterium]